jgi:hypothetical protein
MFGQALGRGIGLELAGSFGIAVVIQEGLHEVEERAGGWGTLGRCLLGLVDAAGGDPARSRLLLVAGGVGDLFAACHGVGFFAGARGSGLARGWLGGCYGGVVAGRKKSCAGNI